MGEQKILRRHFDDSEVQAAYRGERDEVERSHLLVIWSLLSGDLVLEVARVTGRTGLDFQTDRPPPPLGRPYRRVLSSRPQVTVPKVPL